MTATTPDGSKFSESSSPSATASGQIAHYRILESLGAGSMGAVYRAEDMRLRRQVALKVIHNHIENQPDLRLRFEREARAASHLEHPNICTVYEFGETDDHQLYLAMAYYPGETLAQRLKRGTPSLDESLHIAASVARALHHAHVRHVIHRDIKPMNIMLYRSDTGVVPKVLDFGIAKVIDAEEITESGTLIGTPAYMAPETVDERPVDHRADLWALGVVLYEMLAARRPFQGKPTVALMLAIKTEVPPPLPDFARTLGLERLCLRLLAKDPEQRPDSALAVAEELARIAMLTNGPTVTWVPSVDVTANVTRPVVRPIPSECRVAVLPFLDLSSSRDQDYFTEGLTEELNWALASVPGLRLIAGSSAAKAQAEGLDIAAIGERLSVEYLLEGSVRRIGASLRITCRLLDVGEGAVRWQERLNRELTDLLGVQEEIANRLVESLPLRATGGGPARLLPARAHTKHPEAYQIYLQARLSLAKRTATDLQNAIGLFERCLEHDPDYALAYAGLADAHALLAGPYGGEEPRKGMEAALRAVNAAVARAPDLAEAYCSLGCIHCFYEWDFDKASDTFRRSLSLAEGYATAHHWFAMNLLMVARFDEAAGALERARTLDPSSSATAVSVGLVEYCRGDHESAIERYDRVLADEQDFALAHFFRGEALAELHRFEESLVALDRARVLSNDAVEIVASLAAVCAKSGNSRRCSELRDAIEDRALLRYVSKYRLAQIALAQGDDTQSLALLSQAVDERCADLVWLKARPNFSALRGNPTFELICQRVFESPSQVLTLGAQRTTVEKS